MKRLLVLITSILALNSYAFAFEPSNSEGLEAYIYLESKQSGGVSKVWATDCNTCSRKAFSVTDETVFKHLDTVIDQGAASLHSGKGGVIIYQSDTLEATQVVFFQ